MNLELNIAGCTLSLRAGVYFSRNRKVKVKGTTNRTADGKYVLYLDYDKLPLDNVLSELSYMQQLYFLGDIMILKSSENCFHAVCFDKLTAREFTDILLSSSADINFKRIPAMYSIRSWVLRFSGKRSKPAPVFDGMLLSRQHIREQSSAHFEFFKRMYPDAKLRVLSRPDSIDDVEVIEYETRAD